MRSTSVNANRTKHLIIKYIPQWTVLNTIDCTGQLLLRGIAVCSQRTMNAVRYVTGKPDNYFTKYNMLIWCFMVAQGYRSEWQCEHAVYLKMDLQLTSRWMCSILQYMDVLQFTSIHGSAVYFNAWICSILQYMDVLQFTSMHGCAAVYFNTWMYS